MKFNKQTKDELRTKIIEQLANVPDGERLHLDKALLEDLLFETYSDKEEEREIVVKYIVWSGPFLSKIDLSEISFDNVCWDPTPFCEAYMNFYKDYKKKTKPIKEMIDLSNTNAKIDFSKAFVMDYDDDDILSVYNCNFANVDLSNSHAEKIVTFTNCNFSNTNANIFDERDFKKRFFLVDCDFSNNDFSKIEIKSDYFYGVISDCLDGKGVWIENCNFSNTGLKIEHIIKPFLSFSEQSKMREEYYKFDGKSSPLSLAEINELGRINEILKENQQRLECAVRLSQHIKAGFLAGCYVNGELIHSKEESQEIAQAIEEQLNHIKR